MNNTTEIINKKRAKLKDAIATLIILAVVFSIVIVIFSMIITKNCNGVVDYVEITIKEISTQNDSTAIISEKGQEYILGSLDDAINWSDYLGKTVTIVVPNEQFLSDPWLVGLIDKDNNVIIDYRETIAERKEEDITFVSVISAIVGLGLIAAAVLFYFYRKNPKNSKVSIDEAVWMVYGNVLPKTPKRKKAAIPMTILCILIFAFCLLMAIFGDSIESDIVGGVLTAGICLFIIASLVSIYVICLYYLPKEEIKYYKANYPFNSDDVSHLPLKKSLKQQLAEERKEARRLHPDDYLDCANGFDASFTNEGLHLSLDCPEDDVELYNDGVFEEFDSPDQDGYVRVFSYTIPYDELHFEAIAKYRRFANMFGVIIKSKLSGEKSYPKEMEYDIHFMLDSNLVATFRKFNIEVNGLDEILNNVEGLMTENCKKAKSGLNVNQY